MKANIITISFKNTIEDIKLYSWIISKSSLSGFIKDILRREYENEKRKEIINNWNWNQLNFIFRLQEVPI